MTGPRLMLANIKKADRIVIKVGTSLVTRGDGMVDTAHIQSICRQTAQLLDTGLKVIIVSSGAVGLGMGKMGWRKRPRHLEKLQACAAIGQSALTQTWQEHFQPYGIVVGQILLTRDDVAERKRHVAIKNTIETLLNEGVVPILNENDSVSAEELEIQFGDNDILSALVASLAKADILAILTTVRGLLDLEDDRKLIEIVETISPKIEALARGTQSQTSVGGMAAKIEAAKVATRSGCCVFIGSGRQPGILVDLVTGKPEGTFFIPSGIPLESKKRWLAFFGHSHGSIQVDAGAVMALKNKGSSLLAKGITACHADFPTQTLIDVVDEKGNVFARGLTQFSSADLRPVLGKSSREIANLYPARKRMEVIHRDSLVLLRD